MNASEPQGSHGLARLELLHVGRYDLGGRVGLLIQAPALMTNAVPHGSPAPYGSAASMEGA